VTTIHFQKVKVKVKTKLAASGGLRTSKKGEPHAAERRLRAPDFSGSPRIGNETRFQAHSALESNIDFRLTFELENGSRKSFVDRSRSHQVSLSANCITLAALPEFRVARMPVDATAVGSFSCSTR
jgi:hypothetical protein